MAVRKLSIVFFDNLWYQGATKYKGRNGFGIVNGKVSL